MLVDKQMNDGEFVHQIDKFLDEIIGRIFDYHYEYNEMCIDLH